MSEGILTVTQKDFEEMKAQEITDESLLKPGTYKLRRRTKTATREELHPSNTKVEFQMKLDLDVMKHFQERTESEEIESLQLLFNEKLRALMQDEIKLEPGTLLTLEADIPHEIVAATELRAKRQGAWRRVLKSMRAPILRSLAARSRSSSITVSFSQRSSSGSVSAPRPGPISISAWPGFGSIALTIASRTPVSVRKCWPKRFLG